MKPYLRGAPPGLPFTFDVETLRRGLNFTLTTDAGPIDLLAHAIPAILFGAACSFIDLDTLIASKKAAGRPKDLETIAELEAIREERRSG
ncbi:MAG TPA: hypothetical protein VF824_17530 [Thermoanaerobaculia bacterium]